MDGIFDYAISTFFLSSTPPPFFFFFFRNSEEMKRFTAWWIVSIHASAEKVFFFFLDLASCNIAFYERVCVSELILVGCTMCTPVEKSDWNITPPHDTWFKNSHNYHTHKSPRTHTLCTSMMVPLFFLPSHPSILVYNNDLFLFFSSQYDSDITFWWTDFFPFPFLNRSSSSRHHQNSLSPSITPMEDLFKASSTPTRSRSLRGIQHTTPQLKLKKKNSMTWLWHPYS